MESKNKMYEIQKMSSCVIKIPETDFKEILKKAGENFSEAFVILWLHYEVLFGTYRNGGLNFYKKLPNDFEKYLIKARIFDEEKELYVWREKDSKFSGRLRKDGTGKDEIEFVESKQVMYGKKFERIGNGFTKVSETKGIEYIVPDICFNTHNNLNESGITLVLYSRNYIGYNQIGQAGFVDCRFVKIKAIGGQENE